MTHSIMALSLRRTSAARPVIGLDIEPGRIVAAQVSVNGSVRLERVASVELAAGVVRDGEIIDIAEVTAALKRLWARQTGRHRLSHEVRVGVANAKIVVRTIDVPPVTERSEIDAAVRQLAADELPMPMESAMLDYVPVGIVETPTGPRLRVVVTAARREMIESVLAAVTAAGLKPRGIDLSAFAMIRILGRGQLDSALYLSVGGVTNLAVVVDGVCTFARVSGVGMESMAIDLAARRDLTLEHARLWLTHVGLERDLAEIDGDEEIVADSRSILVQGARRLASDVRQSFEFHLSQTVSPFDFERTILTGSAASVPGFADALAVELAMQVETRSVEAGNDLAADADLAGATIAAGLAVEQVTA
jgi:type IV pilus assembly protein PilM